MTSADQPECSSVAAIAGHRPLSVEVISPCLMHQADAPYSTRMRALAMRSAGMDVEVFARPDAYPSSVGDLGVKYRGRKEEVSAATRRRLETAGNQGGNYWRFIGDPYFTMRFGLSRALERGCDIVFIADVEPWVGWLLFTEFSLRSYPLPIVGMVPGNYDVDVGERLTTRIRFGMNSRFSKLLPRLIDVVGTSEYILSTLRIDRSQCAHVVPEGHENHLGEKPRDEARGRLDLPLNERMVLLFGVAGRSKGADVLFEAMESVPPDFVVCIVGMTGDVYEASWGSTERLEKVGWTRDKLRIVSRYVSEEEMHDYYAACDAVIVPYKKGFAGTSTHLRRATEYGKAILACDQYHIGAQVQRYELGLTFKTNDADSLAECLRRFAELPASDLDKIYSNSKRLLQDESWDQVGVTYRKLFESVLQRNRKRRRKM